MKGNHFFAAALVAAGLTASALAAPVVLINDDFSDGDRDNNGITDDGNATPVASPTGTPFYLARGTSSATVSVVNDNVAGGLNGGNALQNISATATQRPLLANFASTTLAAGESLSVSFDYRLTGTIPDADRPFRFGFYNNGGTPITADTAASANTEDDFGYYVSQDTGTGGASTNVLSILGDAAPTLIGGTSVGLGATTTNTAYGLTSTAAHRAVLTINRNGDDLQITFALDNLAVLTGNAVNGNATTSPLTYTFNEFVIGENGAILGFLIDNVNVTYNQVPEPSSLALLALGGLGLTRRRR